MRRTTTTIIARWLHCIVAVAALGASSSAIATAAADNCPTGSMAALPPSAYITLNNGLVLCRITTGMWQLSGGHAHRVSESNIDRAVADMAALVRAGFTSFDLADHYGNAEDVVGYFHSAHPELASKAVFMTKWVPQPGPMPESAVLSALDVSRRRMKMATLDLVQFHWWDYAVRSRGNEWSGRKLTRRKRAGRKVHGHGRERASARGQASAARRGAHQF